MLKYLKILLISILALNITLIPVCAEVFDYSKYDFSDDAQRQFDNQNTYNPVSNNDNYSVEKTKNKNQTPIYNSNENNQNNQNYSNYPDYDYVNYDNYNEDNQDNSQNQQENYNQTNQNKSEQSPQNQNNYQDSQPQTDNYNNYQSQSNQPLQGSVTYIPSGTTFDVVFESGISSGSLDKDDRLTATLPQDFVYNGKVVAPAGSMVSGSVSDSKSAGYAYGSGSMAIQFDEIEPTNGEPFKISTETIVVTGKSSRAKNMTRDVLIGTGMGILGGMLGFLLTGGAGSEDFVRAIAIGGGIGTVAGGAKGAMTRGDDVKIPDGTKIQLKLTQPINISPYNN